MTRPIWKLTEDRRSVIVTLNGNPTVALQLDVESVDLWLRQLGECRSLMEPRSVERWKPGQAVSAIVEPNWTAELDSLQARSLLHVRDPRFGWLHYLLMPVNALKLGELLIKQAGAASKQAHPSRKN